MLDRTRSGSSFPRLEVTGSLALALSVLALAIWMDAPVLLIAGAALGTPYFVLTLVNKVLDLELELELELSLLLLELAE